MPPVATSTQPLQIKYTMSVSIRLFCHWLAAGVAEADALLGRQDKATCANVQANGGSCTYPACGCAEPPKSK